MGIEEMKAIDARTVDSEISGLDLPTNAIEIK